MLSDKKLARIEKELGKEFLRELDAADATAVEAAVVNAGAAIKQAEDELEANPKFQEIREARKAISAGLSEVKKRQKAIIEYSLHLLEERN